LARPFTISGSSSDAVIGFGDLVPQFNLRWNQGVNNYMVYATGNLTTGRYNPTRLPFNPQTGHELSATLGFTYNFANVHTDYQNGIDIHLDMGASQFLTKQLQVGLVGYWYNQLSCNSGTGDRAGFRIAGAGIGPQFGYIIPISNDYQGYWMEMYG